MTVKQVRKQNQRNREKKIRRLIKANFQPGDLWVTLKYPRGTRKPLGEVRTDLEYLDGTVKNLAAGSAEYADLVKQLAENVPSYELTDTKEIKRLLGGQLPGWEEGDWEELRAAAEGLRKWEQQEKTVTMTQGQWGILVCYLLISTKYREDEADAWARLAEEKEEDGIPKYKNAAGNAEYWRQLTADLEGIRKKIEEV